MPWRRKRGDLEGGFGGFGELLEAKHGLVSLRQLGRGDVNGKEGSQEKKKKTRI